MSCPPGRRPPVRLWQAAAPAPCAEAPALPGGRGLRPAVLATSPQQPAFRPPPSARPQAPPTAVQQWLSEQAAPRQSEPRRVKAGSSLRREPAPATRSGRPVPNRPSVASAVAAPATRHRAQAPASIAARAAPGAPPAGIPATAAAAAPPNSARAKHWVQAFRARSLAPERQNTGRQATGRQATGRRAMGRRAMRRQVAGRQAAWVPANGAAARLQRVACPAADQFRRPRSSPHRATHRDRHPAPGRACGPVHCRNYGNG